MTRTPGRRLTHVAEPLPCDICGTPTRRRVGHIPAGRHAGQMAALFGGAVYCLSVPVCVAHPWNDERAADWLDKALRIPWIRVVPDAADRIMAMIREGEGGAA